MSFLILCAIIYFILSVFEVGRVPSVEDYMNEPKPSTLKERRADYKRCKEQEKRKEAFEKARVKYLNLY